MKKIVNTQAELDSITRIDTGDEVIVQSALRLNAKLKVFGILHLETSLDCSFNLGRYIEAWGNSSVTARENSSVTARGNSSVKAWGNSFVEAWGNSFVTAQENSSVKAWENSSVIARGNSSVTARGNSSVKALDNSSVTARGNSSVTAWENSSVIARGNSSVTARGNSLVRLSAKIRDLSLYDFSILSMPFDLKFEFKKEKTCLVQKYKPQQYLDREGISATNKHVILFKRVSGDFKTQEGTNNETLWNIGSVVTHLNWEPDSSECGPGKFHACSRPYFCDEFRSVKNDKYIAIEINKKDLHEWKNPHYPHKIAFRSGKVLYVCDKFGKEIKN